MVHTMHPRVLHRVLHGGDWPLHLVERGQHEVDVVEDDVVEHEASDVAQDEEHGIGNDGAGFPGGPSDTSLLTRYQDHVARIIWEGDNVDFYHYLGYLLLKKSTPPELLTHLILTFTLFLWINTI